MPIVPALRRRKEVGLCEFEVTLLYIVGPGKPGLQSETLSQKNEQIQSKTYIISKGGIIHLHSKERYCKCRNINTPC